MSDTAEFRMGCEVAASDGVCGKLSRVVVHPIARAITHLVVEPRHRRGAGHLVPVELVASTGEEVRLKCTKSEFGALEDAEETWFLPGPSGSWAYDREQMLSLPYFELGLTPVGRVEVIGLDGIPTGGFGTGMGEMATGAVPPAITIDRVPAGEVEIRRGEHVHATDGQIGRVQGLVVDPSDHHVTHVLLDEGHLWDQKRVAIPIGAVKSAHDGVQLKLTKDEVRDLPPVALAQPE